MSKETVSVEEAAKRLGLGIETVQDALVSGEFPVGCALKCKGGKRRYIIPRIAFENFMRGRPYEGLEAAFTGEGAGA